MQEEINEAINSLIRLKDLTLGIEKSNEEIHMWRGRFLASVRHENDSVKSALVCHTFYYIPSINFMEKSPETHLQEIERHMNETKQA